MFDTKMTEQESLFDFLCLWKKLYGNFHSSPRIYESMILTVYLWRISKKEVKIDQWHSLLAECNFFASLYILYMHLQIHHAQSYGVFKFKSNLSEHNLLI